MSARQKLNAAHFLGAVAIAAVIGVVAQSWTVFAVATVVLIVTAISDGGIRMDRGRERKRRHRK